MSSIRSLLLVRGFALQLVYQQQNSLLWTASLQSPVRTEINVILTFSSGYVKVVHLFCSY